MDSLARISVLVLIAATVVQSTGPARVTHAITTNASSCATSFADALKHASRGKSASIAALGRHLKGLVLFVGYPRSGHSLVGSIMDAHPHMTISHELGLAGYFCAMHANASTHTPGRVTSPLSLRPRGWWREEALAAIVTNSENCAQHGRVQSGYNYTISGLHQGAHAKALLLAGDKRGGQLGALLSDDYNGTVACLATLSRAVDLPLVLVHVVRNPFDVVASSALRAFAANIGARSYNISRLSADPRFPAQLDLAVDNFLGRVDAIARLRACVRASHDHDHDHGSEGRSDSGSDGIDGHCLGGRAHWIDMVHEDMVRNPSREIERMCAALRVVCSEEYVGRAAATVMRELSRTRGAVRWTDEARAKLGGVMEVWPWSNCADR